MQINGISNNDPNALQSLFSQPRQDLQALSTDLSTGNLAGAQKDFASFQKDVSTAFQNTSVPSSLLNGIPAAGTTADLQGLQTALSSNNLAAAQKYFAAYQQDVQAFGGAQQGRHRHHHHVQDGDNQTSQSTDPTDVANSTNPNNPVPDFSVAAMLAAYKAFGGGLSMAGNLVNAVG